MAEELGIDISDGKLFEEYGIYCDSKVIGIICCNQFFVKRLVGQKL